MTSQWIQELTFKYINLYKSEPALWNFDHPQAKSLPRRIEAWERIQSQIGIQCSINDLKAKRESLMTSYRQNVKKIKEHTARGEHFEPSWFAFEPMNSFLKQIYFGEDNINEGDPTAGCNPKGQVEDPEEGDHFENDPGEDEQMVEYLIEDEDLLTAENVPTKEEPQLPRLKKKSIAKKLTLSKINCRYIERSDQYAKPKIKSLGEEDECELYARLLAKKLRKFSEKNRDLVMMEIDNIIFRTKMRIAQAKRETKT